MLLKQGGAKRRPPVSFLILSCPALHVHPHAAAAAAAWHRRLLFRDVTDQRAGGQNHGGDGTGILHGAAGDLDRVDDASLQHVDIVVGQHIVAGGQLGLVQVQHPHLLDHHAAFQTGIASDHAHGLFQRAAQNAHARARIAFQGDLVQGRHGIDQRHTTARDDALFHSRTGGAQGVLDAVLLFLQLGLGGSTHADDRHAAGQLGQAFLQLLTVVVAGAGLDLGANLVDAILDRLAGARAADDGGVVLGAHDLVAAAQVFQLDAVQLAAQSLR